MTKVTGPLFSVRAKGSLGDGISFQGQRQGVRVERRPRHKDRESGAQLEHRASFLAAVAYWHALGGEAKVEYAVRGHVLQMTGYNLFVREYLLGKVEVGPGETDIVVAADTYLSDLMPDTPFGSSTQLFVTYSSGKGARRDHSVLKFNVAELAGKSGIEASLWVLVQGAADFGYDAYVRRLTRPGWEEMEASWLEWASGEDWTVPGGDYDGSTPPQVVWTLPTEDGFWLEIAGVEGHVIDGLENREGLVHLHLMTATIGAGELWLASRETAGGGNAPYLRVTWTG